MAVEPLTSECADEVEAFRLEVANCELLGDCPFAMLMVIDGDALPFPLSGFEEDLIIARGAEGTEGGIDDVDGGGGGGMRAVLLDGVGGGGGGGGE